jgi:glycosyltransferase involved in cell wall biosynthesis
MRRIRLAYLIPSLRAGGSERQMLALAERLPRDRYDIDFLALIGHGEWDAQAVAAGAHVQLLGSKPASFSPLVSRLAARGRKALSYVELVRRERYDIIDAWLYPADTFAILMRPLTRWTPVISGRRNVDAHQLLGPLDGPLDRLVGRTADAIVANSAAAARNAIEVHRADPARITVIRNGVEAAAALDPGERARTRRDLGADDDTLLIGCVANYRPVKQHDLLIDAFAEVASGMPQARLALIGEGESRPALEQQIARLDLDDRVRLHGPVSNARILYAAFDIVVQASRGEGLPNQLLEAAAAERTFVATDVGGTNEIALDGVTGLLVPPDDTEALSRAMRRILEDSTLRIRLAANARAHVLDAFGMDRCVREWDRLYQEVAGRRPVPPD